MALPTKLKLEIVTPERLLLSEEVDEVTIPGSEGYLGILPGHLPLLTMLGIGVLSNILPACKKSNGRLRMEDGRMQQRASPDLLKQIVG